MTAEYWREVLEAAADNETLRELLVQLLAEQDAARAVLQRRFGWTGLPWSELVGEIVKAFEEGGSIL